MTEPRYKAGYTIDDYAIWLVQQTNEFPRICPINPGSLLAMLGNPVNVISGNKHERVPTVLGANPGIPLEAELIFDSLTSTNLMWRHNYEWSLDDTETVFDGETNSWKVLGLAGDALYFKDLNGVYESPPGIDLTLTSLSNGTYELEFGTGQIAEFASSGRLESIDDAFGNTLTFTYDVDTGSVFRLEEVAHDNGLALDFVWDGDELTDIYSPDTNLAAHLSYASTGSTPVGMTIIVSGLGINSTNTYGVSTTTTNNNVMLVNRTNAINVVSKWEYDTSDSVAFATSSETGSNEYMNVDVEHPSSSERTATFTRRGKSVEYAYSIHPVFNRIESISGPVDANGAASSEISFEFDERGNATVVRHSDWGSQETLILTREYNADDHPTNTSYGLNQASTNFWAYTWDSDHDLLASITDPEGHRMEFTYTNGMVTTSRLVVDTNTSYETVLGYTTNGLLAAVTNANGHVVEYSYDSYGYLTEIDPQTGPTVTLSNNALGQLVQIELPGWQSSSPSGDPDPRVIELEPDGLGQVRTITYPDELEETFDYDAIGNLVTNVDRAGRAVCYTYEPLGRLASATRYLIGTSTQAVTTAFDYDQQFNTLSITDPRDRVVEAYQLDELDRATAVTNVEGQVMSVQYGVGNYVRHITRFDQSEVLFFHGYDGRLAWEMYDDDTLGYTYYRNDLLETVTNSAASISNAYNSVNRLTSVVLETDALSTGDVQVAYAYFPAGQVSNVTSEAGSQTYGYDAAERVTNIVDGVARTFTYDYNPYNGLVETVEYPNGISCALDYDILDRLTGITWTGPSGTLHSLSCRYDAAGMITGRVEESSSGMRTTAFSYDSIDRLTGETYSDSAGVYDEATYGYDLAGNRTSKTRNNVAVTYALGAGNRMTNWTAVVSTNAEAVVDVAGYSSEDIGMNPLYGERTVNDELAEVAGSNYWASTVLSDLSQATQTVIAVMGDEAGNVGRATNIWTLTIITNAAYTHDAAGNVTDIAFNSNHTVLALDWNSQYQLLSVSNASEAIESYTYDPFGRRLTTSGDGETILHAYDGVHCIADLDEDGDLVRNYTFGPGIDNPLAMTVFSATETNTYCYLTDHLGNVLALADGDGHVVERYEYDAWGRVAVFDASNQAMEQSKYGNRITFQGREYSWATGLYYFRARWYDPIAGRFLSKDPIGISGGLNQYVAFGNNPVRLRDPWGLTAAGMDLSTAAEIGRQTGRMAP